MPSGANPYGGAECVAQLLTSRRFGSVPDRRHRNYSSPFSRARAEISLVTNHFSPLYALLRRIGAGGRRVAVMALNFARLRTRWVGADLESDCGAEEVCGLTGRV